jgi:hypothetical protein
LPAGSWGRSPGAFFESFRAPQALNDNAARDGGARGAVAQQQRLGPDAETGALRPPGEVRGALPPRRPPSREPGFFEKLFGG